MSNAKRMPMDYDEFSKYFKVEDGKLIRLIGAPGSAKGTAVGTNSYGYLMFGHKKKIYFVHRAIYLLMKKELPEYVDHINGDKLDNRIENLRGATICTNAYNAKLSSRNTSGCKGIHKIKDGSGYQVSIRYNNIRKYLGKFKDFDDAKEFISLAREMVHGEYANHGVAYV